MEINPKNIRTLSVLGQRGTFGTALNEIAANNEKIVALSADLCNTSGLDRFKTSYPARFLNTGIAEQNLVGVAAGLADSGNIPFASTFANFVALRSCEMVRHFMGYMKCNVKMVGLAAGFAMELFGNTHYGLEDIATMRAIPNLIILSPADGLETYKCVIAAAEIKAPVYIRLTGTMSNPVVYKDDYSFKIGAAVTLQHGKDVGIIATGSMVARAQKTALELHSAGIECSVINMHTIKPMDCQALTSCLDKKLIVTIEEHSRIGGLGSAVSEFLATKNQRPPLLVLGTGDSYQRAGDYDYMLSVSGLTEDKIIESIKARLKEIQ